MATNWYYRFQDGRESDPVRFRELAGLIRCGEIESTTEVHPEYDPEWRSAEDVAGLIYTARKVAEKEPDREVSTIAGAPENEVEPTTLEKSPTIDSQDGVTTSKKPSNWFWCLFAWLPSDRQIVFPSSVEEAVPGANESGAAVATLQDGGKSNQASPCNNLATTVPQESASNETELSTQAVEATDNSDECESGSTFDIMRLFDDELAHASIESLETTSTAKESKSQEDCFRGAQSEENHPDLGAAISDAVQTWDQNHTQAAQIQSEDTPRAFGAGLHSILILLKQWLERLMLRVFKIPIEIAGWMVRRGDKLIAKIADRVGHESFLIGFRLSMAIVAANTSIFAIEALAVDEAMRFPGWQQARGLKSFPILGECSLFEYWFLTVDVAIVAGVFAFRLAKRIEFLSAP